MPNYSNSIIYLMKAPEDILNENFYIGSTTNMRRRINNHNFLLKNDYNNTKKYVYLRDMGCKKPEFEILEKYECNNRTELLKKENEFIKNLKPSLNAKSAYLTDEEYKSMTRNINKQYYQMHKVELTKKALDRYYRIKNENKTDSL